MRIFSECLPPTLPHPPGHDKSTPEETGKTNEWDAVGWGKWSRER